MGLPRRRDAIRKDRHSLVRKTPQSTFCQAGQTLRGHSQLHYTKRPTEVSHRCRKYLPESRLGHNRRRTWQGIHEMPQLSWSPCQRPPVPSPLPHDLRESEDLVPLVGNRNGRRSRIIASYDPNAIIFWLVVDPRAESSGDSNLVGATGGSRNHVVMEPVSGKSQKEMASRNERTGLITGERAYYGSSGALCLGFEVLDA